MSDGRFLFRFSSEVCFPRCRATTTIGWPRWSVLCVRNMGFLTASKQCGKALLMFSGKSNTKSSLSSTAGKGHVEVVNKRKLLRILLNKTKV